MLHSSLLTQLDEVARCGSIRGASDVLHVSASSINRRLILLEEEIGMPLFHRQATGMRLTAAGELVIAHIRQTLREHERLRHSLRELRGTNGLRVRISAMHGLAAGVLPRILREFRAAHPGITVRVRAQTTAGVEDDLKTGEADLGLAYAWPPGQGIAASAVFPTRLGLVVGEGHPLAGLSDVRLIDLLDWPIAIADETITIHHLIRAAFSAAGLRLRPTYLSNSIELLKSMARAHEAVTFLSRIDVDEDLRTGQLAYVPILGRELANHELRLGRRPGSTLETAVTLTEEHLRRAFARIDVPAMAAG
mgnify:FL=1